jgi:ribonuclease HI
VIVRLRFDGGSRGNPGPAAAGYYLSDESGVICRRAVFLGVATNNVAEYTAALKGVEEAAERGFDGIQIFGDSKLVICQLTGAWQCRSRQLTPLLTKTKDLLNTKFETWEARHIPRAQNREADRLVNLALDSATPDSWA